MAILRIDGVTACTGHRSKTSIYAAIKAGLFTKPVPIGQRTVGWPDFEVETLNAARIAGQTEDVIRALVGKLHTQRAERFNALSLATDPAPTVRSNVVQLGAVQ